MNKTEIANRIIEGKESMVRGGEDGASFVNRADGSKASNQAARNLSIIPRVISEAKP
jgi:hypothetical protein